jgi:hypothetical protein
MNYAWTECPKCGCQITIQFADSADRLTGSLRRWSSDRSVNDGRRLEIPRAEIAADGGFRAPCVCGETIPVAGASIEHATTA